eukprot:jgi/Hompol1/6837/HPOL_002344-RA
MKPRRKGRSKRAKLARLPGFDDDDAQNAVPRTKFTNADNEIKQRSDLRKKRAKRRKNLKDDVPMLDEEVREIQEEEIQAVSKLVELTKWIPNWKRIIEENIRDLNAEGLYIGDPPKIQSWNSHRLNQRLMISEDNNLFGNDPVELDSTGAVAQRGSLPDQDRQSPFSFDSEISLERRTAELPSQHNLWRSSMDTYCTMIVDLVDMQFQSHPLMIEEIHLANHIYELVRTMQERKRDSIVDFLTAKLQSIKNTSKLARSQI